MEIRPDYEVKLPNLARQVESDIRTLRMQAESARNLAQRAASDCERNAQQTFAYQCEEKARDLQAYLEQILREPQGLKNVTCSKPGASLARDTTLKPF
jgi:predicted  nucleic acid-binding Zn-ribbon protein